MSALMVNDVRCRTLSSWVRWWLTQRPLYNSKKEVLINYRASCSDSCWSALCQPSWQPQFPRRRNALVLSFCPPLSASWWKWWKRKITPCVLTDKGSMLGEHRCQNPVDPVQVLTVFVIFVNCCIMSLQGPTQGHCQQWHCLSSCLLHRHWFHFFGVHLFAFVTRPD